MILDNLEYAIEYRLLHPGFVLAFDFLTRTDLETLEPGRHELRGDTVYANVDQATGVGREAAKLEYHRKYIDIQYVVAGEERIGWRPIHRCAIMDRPYSESTDAGFYADRPDVWLPVEAGQFVVFFPHDAHAPLAGTGDLRKVVVKIAVNYPEADR